MTVTSITFGPAGMTIGCPFTVANFPASTPVDLSPIDYGLGYFLGNPPGPEPGGSVVIATTTDASGYAYGAFSSGYLDAAKRLQPLFEFGCEIFNGAKLDTRGGYIWDFVSEVYILNCGTTGGDSPRPTIGFLGADRVPQAPAIADADGTLADLTAKFHALRDAIKALGFIA